MRRLASGRIVGLLIAIIGTGISIWCARDALRMNAEFRQWFDARPMETAIDLSQPGKTTTPFHQTCSISHGEGLYLECDLGDDSNQDLEGLFKDLSANVVIEDSDGNAIESVKINNGTVRYWEGLIMLTGFAPFSKGDYVATIRIHTGAAALADKQQTVYAKYQLCGLEQMPAMISGAFAFGAGIIGLVAMVCVLPGLLRRGIWLNISPDSAEPTDERACE